MRIDIKNFQSIADAKLFFPVGVTTIVGPSNSGKTAIIRALSCVLTNSSDAKSFIKHGELKTEVTLEDVMNVTWSRTAKDSFYEIEGELHQKVGKTDLFDLVDDTGFFRDSEGNIINIQDEWSTLFPFDRNPAQIYKLFESTFGGNPASEVLKVIKDDEASRKKLIVGYGIDLTKNENKLKMVSSFLKDNSLDDLRKRKEELTETVTSYQNISRDMHVVTEGIKTLNKLRTIERKQFDLSEVSKLASLEKDIKYVEDSERIINFNEKIVKFDLLRVDKLKDICKDIEYIELNTQLTEASISMKRFDFSKLSTLNELNRDVEDLSKLIGSHQKLKGDLKLSIEKKLILEEKLSKIKVCPLCNREM